MALPSRPGSISFLLLLLLISSISTAAENIAGVAYGRDANNLIPPDRVVELLKANSIGAVSIYDTDPGVLRAFANSGIKVVVALPNDKLRDATNQDFADTWVSENVKAYYPATQIIAVKVGNEVFQQSPDLTSSLVRAMQNVYNGLVKQGLADAIKVSSPVSFGALDVSFPPSKGRFRGDLQPVLRQMLDFLRRTDSCFMVNLYPYIAKIKNPNIPLDYTLGLPNSGQRDTDTGLTYYSLLDAQRDALYSAMDALEVGTTATADASRRVIKTWHSENGMSHPPGISGGGLTWKPAAVGGRGTARNVSTQKTGRTGGKIWNASLAEGSVTTVENAKAYNNILVQRILDGRTGTPLHPDADMSVFIFSLFNENLKPESERDFGIFYPDGTPVYELQFRRGGGGGDSWCVAEPAAGRDKMQRALDWACGPGGVDCGPIRPGGRCYTPDTVEAHASYAMNNYYQKHNRGPSTCDFNGAGRVVNQNPNLCPVSPDSWCVANPDAGITRMKAALDWACGQGGADCGPIQPGAGCYEPNTMEAHASYAMNSYYQKKNRGDGTCNFNGVGRIVYQRPKYGNCELPSSP